MKNIVFIIISILAIFALLYFSNPPKFIHYLLASVAGINVMKLLYSMFKRRV